MEIKNELERIVGSGNVFDSYDVIDAYSKDYSLIQASLPKYVVQPKESSEIQSIMSIANEHRIPVVPSSSEVHFYGATIPRFGGIILDLRRMNKILNINEADLSVQIEAGVTWEQLQNSLGKKGYRSVIPLLPHARRSVLTTWLEVEYPTVSIYEYGMPTQSMHVVWADGTEFTTGSASVTSFGQPGCYAAGVNPQGPGAIDFFKLFQGAQGTMGVVTWAMFKFEQSPVMDKTFFIPLNQLEDAIEPIYKIHRLKIGSEFLLINNFNLASIIAQSRNEDFDKLRKILPEWTIIIIISALRRRPEEKIEYEVEALQDIMKSDFSGLNLQDELTGVPNLEAELPYLLRNPWPGNKAYWKHGYKGGCQDLFFITTLERVPRFIESIDSVLTEHKYPKNQIGCYIQPIENARACHCEFNFFYNPQSQVEKNEVQQIYLQAAETLIDMGAFFTRPYGVIADMVYKRTTGYTEALKKFKNLVDPNNIMCPGNLCF